MTNTGMDTDQIIIKGRALAEAFLVAQAELDLQVAEHEGGGLEPSNQAYYARDDAGVALAAHFSALYPDLVERFGSR